MTFNAKVDGLDTLSGALARIADETELAGEIAAAAEAVRANARANLSDGQPPDTPDGRARRVLEP